LNFWLQHLPVLPIVTPLAAGAAMLLLADTRRYTRGAIALVSTLGQLAAAIALLVVACLASGRTGSESIWWATGPRPSASCWWSTAWLR